MEYKIDLEAEKKEILRRYKDLISVWESPKMTVEKQRDIRKAFNLAVEAHKDMRRKSGEPYIYHPIEVAKICAKDIGLGSTSIICALLHDVVEDTDYTLEDIEKLFNPKVAEIIDGLTKIDVLLDSSISYSKQAENFKKILLSMTKDVRVILIKLADRLHNMSTLDAMKPASQLKIASETVSFYAPLAHRLGLHQIKSQLEDYALKYTEPEMYNMLSSKIKITQDERDQFIASFLKPIIEQVDQLGVKYRTEARMKSLTSIANKMKKQNIQFEEVYDIFAVRIIVDVPFDQEKSTCYNVLHTVHNIYKKQHPKRYRDFLLNPKANDYQSLHTTVMGNAGKWVEIQIRTERMDEIAERGYAAHWKYKNELTNVEIESNLEKWINQISQLLKESELHDSTIDFFDQFKLNLFTDEINVFTMHGDLRTLPKGATVLDFAYGIHSEVGDNALGAKINHKVVSLNQVLQSGDQIEVITTNSLKVESEWLEFVVTPRAINHIKKALKQKHKASFDAGENRLRGYFKNLNIEFNNENVITFRKYCQYNNNIDLYYYVDKRKVTKNDVKNCFADLIEKKTTGLLRFIPNPFKKKQTKTIKSELRNKVNKIMKENPKGLVIGDVDYINWKTASCCNPIPGDEIIGYNKERNIIETHRISCPIAIDIMSKYGDRIVKAKWRPDEAITALTGITLRGHDKKGLIAELIHIITEKHGINMRSMNIEASDGVVRGYITLYVHHYKELEHVMNDIRKLENIEKVFRINRKEGKR